MFEVNHKEASEGSNLIAEGEYETLIKFAGEDVTKGGTIYISVKLIIRNDVEQKYKNKYIYHALWKRKEPSAADQICQGYSAKQIQTLSKAAGLPNGKKYSGLEDWCEDLKSKVIRVTIKHEEYNGKTQEKVAYVNPSKFPECKHVFKDSNPAALKSNTDDFVEIDEDDLPF